MDNEPGVNGACDNFRPAAERTAETEVLAVAVAGAGNPGLMVEACEDEARVESEGLLMVEFPNDGRGRVSDGRWVVKEEDVAVEVAVAIWWKRSSVGSSRWRTRRICLLNETAVPSLSSPDVFTHLGIGRESRKLRVDDDWRSIDESLHVAYFSPRVPY